MMKKSRYFILPIVMVFLIIFTGKGFSAPKVFVEQTVYDAGVVPEGKDIAHEFVLKNTGDKTLSFKIKPC